MIQVHRNAADRWRFWLAPNRSLDAQGAVVLFLVMATGCLGIATWFALQGLWMPLPFAGAEVLVLGYCWRRVLRAGDEHETIEVTPQRVVVASDRHGGGRQRCDFQTCWTRVELSAGTCRGYPRRLLLGSHGRRLEVGRFLPEQERERLYGELTASLRAVGI